MQQCVYCGLHDPSARHFQAHNHMECEDKGLDARTFSRKDPLRQHLRHVHNCTMMPWMDRWKSGITNINSRCGFCAERFTVWKERVDHLTEHFKTGAKMAEWKGCRGFDPAIASQVTNAMPPWVIGMEAISKHPFSASNKASWPLEQERVDGIRELAEDASLHRDDIAYDKLTCFEILTLRLIKYVKAQTDQGVIITNEMLQKRAREIMYGSDDAWNQTVADDPEWLDLFKKAHGLKPDGEFSVLSAHTNQPAPTLEHRYHQGSEVKLHDRETLVHHTAKLDCDQYYCSCLTEVSVRDPNAQKNNICISSPLAYSELVGYDDQVALTMGSSGPHIFSENYLTRYKYEPLKGET